MGIFDILNTKPESEAIIKMVSEQGSYGKKIYFDDLFYHSYDGEVDKKGEPIYNKRQIEYVLVYESFEGDTGNVLYSVDGVIRNTNTVNRQVITIVYLKLQDYVREFEKNKLV